MFDLERRRYAIATLRQLAWETAADRSHVDPRAKLRFVQAQRLEPTKQLLARGPRERPAERGLLAARRLSDEHHARQHGLADDHRLVHLRAAAAGAQRALMFAQQAQLGSNSSHDGFTFSLA